MAIPILQDYITRLGQVPVRSWDPSNTHMHLLDCANRQERAKMPNVQYTQPTTIMHTLGLHGTVWSNDTWFNSQTHPEMEIILPWLHGPSCMPRLRHPLPRGPLSSFRSHSVQALYGLLCRLLRR